MNSGEGDGSERKRPTTAVVIAGAGARGAYEAAALQVLLPRLLDDLSSTVFLGTSAGAINAALWAAKAGPGKSFEDVGNEVVQTWRAIVQDRVFVNPAFSTLKLGLQHVTGAAGAVLGAAGGAVGGVAAPLEGPINDAFSLFGAALGIVPQPLRDIAQRFVLNPLGQLVVKPLEHGVVQPVASLFEEISGLLDTGPLHQTASEELHIQALNENIASGRIYGVGVVTTSCPLNGSGGRSRIFMKLRPGAAVPDSPRGSSIDYVNTELTREQVLASAAIPVAFPPVELKDLGKSEYEGWYVDGGVRMNTPIKPALQLGVDRIIVVSSHATRYAASAAPQPGKPDVLDVGALSIHAVLADGMIEDLRTLRRANRQVREARERKQAPPTDSEGRPYREISLIEVSPENGVLSHLAREALNSVDLTKRVFAYGLLSWLLTGAGRGQGYDELLSYLLFEPAYTERQLVQGRKDAERALERCRKAGHGPVDISAQG